MGGTALAQAESKPAPANAVPPGPRAPVDLNTADIPTLEALPEIGTDFANAVVAGRPYKSVDDMARVLKLPPEKMAGLRPKVFVSPPPATAATPRDPRNSTPSKPSQTNDGKVISRQEVTERYDRTQSKDPAPKK
jgi:hypothetical protein